MFFFVYLNGSLFVFFFFLISWLKVNCGEEIRRAREREREREEYF